MAGLLNIGLTGVNAAQGQLITTSHNIANVNTPGFHRQKVIQSAMTPFFSGAGFFGTGTKMTTVVRAYDQFLENQMLSTDTRRAEYAAYAVQIRQIDNMLADPSVGLSPAMDAFFAGLREVAADPTNLSARQTLLSSAQALVGRFHTLDERLTEIREGVEYDIRATIDQINMLANGIAELNQRIVVAQASGTAKPANDLLDQREQLVSELNKLIQVTTKVQDDGTLSVFIGSGQSLVMGNYATRLGTVQDKNDPQRYGVAIIPNNGDPIMIPERLITGGQLAGLLEFRRESLDTTQNRIGMIAVSIASAINNQQKLGVDLGGALGLDLFSLPAPRIMPSVPPSVPGGPPAVSFAFDTDPADDDIVNLGFLTDANYELTFDGANYVITNLSTRASNPNRPDLYEKVLTPADSTFEGLQIDLGAFALAGVERALIQPTRYMARDIKLVITDPRQIAAGCPVIGDVPVTNYGTGKVSDIKMSNVNGVRTDWNLELEYSGGFLIPTFTPAPAGGFSISPSNAFNPTDVTGKTFTITVAGEFEFSFTLSGTPADGDTFNLRPTEAGIADNRNANLLAALQTAKLLFNNGVDSSGNVTPPTATMDSAYSQLVNKVGNKTHEVQTNELTQTTLYEQAREARDALSAVNLDEEAANLVRYQQAYQASGRVMSIAQRLFDEIISIVR
ncbi:MAG: flagellar hook-associated protein FlgK [Betaproteobacteria bacterium]|nr:flagellar hook-associated protein FlgK [Betaproteobacteria bacterium]